MVAKLNAAVQRRGGRPRTCQDKFLAIGFAIDPGTPEQLARRNTAETAKCAKAIRDREDRTAVKRLKRAPPPPRA